MPVLYRVLASSGPRGHAPRRAASPAPRSRPRSAASDRTRRPRRRPRHPRRHPPGVRVASPGPGAQEPDPVPEPSGSDPVLRPRPPAAGVPGASSQGPLGGSKAQRTGREPRAGRAPGSRAPLAPRAPRQGTPHEGGRRGAVSPGTLPQPGDDQPGLPGTKVCACRPWRRGGTRPPDGVAPPAGGLGRIPRPGGACRLRIERRRRRPGCWPRAPPKAAPGPYCARGAAYCAQAPAIRECENPVHRSAARGPWT